MNKVFQKTTFLENKGNINYMTLEKGNVSEMNWNRLLVQRLVKIPKLCKEFRFTIRSLVRIVLKN